MKAEKRSKTRRAFLQLARATTVKWPPTDLKLLKGIYRRYYSEFSSYSDGDTKRSSKVYVPIDIKSIAKDLNVDVDIVFGRLYYHLEPKYGFKNDDGSSVHFFTLRAGDDTNAVQFPLLATVVAKLRAERRRHATATLLSVVAVGISLVSLWLSSISS